MCVQLFTAAGTPVGEQDVGDCQSVVCDGAGNVTEKIDDADPADDCDPCTNDVCNAGAPSHTPKSDGDACAAGSTCLAGACVAKACAGDVGLPGPPVTTFLEKADTFSVADIDGDGKADFVAGSRYATSIYFDRGTFLASPSTYDAPMGVAADLNNDGKPDLISLARIPGSVEVRLNPGNGAFSRVPAIYAVPTIIPNLFYYSPTSTLLPVDLDGDGFRDVVFAESASFGASFTYHLLFNNGDGTLKPSVTMSPGITGRTSAADMDGDGDVDLVATGGPTTARIWLNKGNGSFDPPVDVGAMTSVPYALDLEDLDGDGARDILVAGYVTNAVLFLRNLGNASFAAPVSYPVQMSPEAVLARDVNGDGHKDLVTTSDFGVLSIRLNNGNGTFAPSVTGAPVTADQIIPLDMDGDGKIDLAGGNPSMHGIVLYKNQGNSTFKASQHGIDGGSRCLTSVDLNGDGKLDMAICGPSTNALVALDGGAGSYHASINYAVKVNSPADVMVAADFNADGKVDLAMVGNNLDGLQILTNLGDGTFGPSKSVDTSLSTSSRGLAAGDLDGDGRADLAVWAIGGIKLLRNQPNGAFSTLATVPTTTEQARSVVLGDLTGDGKLDVAGLGYSSSSGKATIAVGKNQGNSFASALITVPTSIGTAGAMQMIDVNGDGKQDLFVGGSFGSLLYVNNGDGTFADPVPYAARVDMRQMLVIDVNGDGKQDLAYIPQSGRSVGVLLNNGDGTLSQGPIHQVGATPYGLTKADPNGDGKADLVVGIAGGTGLRVLTNLGGVFDAPLDESLPGSPNMATTADVDGDGRLDLILAVEPLGVAVYRGQCGGRFSASTIVPETSVKSVAVGDLNGDMLPDLAIGRAGPSGLSVALQNADGTFAPGVTVSSSLQSSSFGTFALEDLDGDGDRDFALLPSSTQEVHVLLNGGDGLTFVAQSYPLSGGLGTLVVADFDGNGSKDIVVAHSQGISLFLNQGDGSLAAPVQYTPGGLTIPLAAADLDGDGRMDLASISGKFVNVRFNQGNGVLGPAISYPAADGGSFLAATDFDHDGKVDLLVAAASQGSLHLLRNRGQGTFAPPFRYGVGSSPRAFAMGDINGDGRLDLMIPNGGSSFSVLPSACLP